MVSFSRPSHWLLGSCRRSIPEESLYYPTGRPSPGSRCSRNSPGPDTPCPSRARRDTILTGQQRHLSSSGENGTHHGTTINRVWEAIGLSPTTWTTLSASWSPATQRQYACALSKWARFISLNNVPPTSPSADQGLCFLQSPGSIIWIYQCYPLLPVSLW